MVGCIIKLYLPQLGKPSQQEMQGNSSNVLLDTSWVGFTDRAIISLYFVLRKKYCVRYNNFNIYIYEKCFKQYRIW